MVLFPDITALALITLRALQYKTTVSRIINSNADFLFIYSAPNYINIIKSDSAIGKMYSFYKRYSINGEKDQPHKKASRVSELIIRITFCSNEISSR